MKNSNGNPQKRGISYEKQAAKHHQMKHVGGPGKPDAQRGASKLEAKNWNTPVHSGIVKTAKKNGVNTVVSKNGFTQPAVKYGEKHNMSLYHGKKKLT